MMDDERQSPSEDYIECARRLRQLHSLIRLGDGDSDQAEELRDEMDDFWIRMSPEEREWSGDLSADLHVLGDKRPMFQDRPIDGAIRQEFLDVIRREDWAGLRPLLLADSNSAGYFDRMLFRSIYWAAMKDFESSLDFLRFLAGRVQADRFEFEVDYLTLDQLAQTGQIPDDIASLRAVGRGALQRIDLVADEINDLILDIQSMWPSGKSVVNNLAVWGALKERFFQAEERARAFFESAA